MAEARPTVMPGQHEKSFLDPTLTECPICLEQFRNPKSLPCLHTFCYECLHTFIQKHASDTNSTVTEFPCPICRRKIQPLDASDQCTKWAGQFPTNNLVSSILEMKDLLVSKKHCSRCQEKNNREEIADLWCRNCHMFLCCVCKELHDDFNRSHVVLSTDEIDCNPTSSITITVRCDKHEEVIKLFCQDHKVLCCSTCVAVEHRKCDTVITVKEQVKNLKEEGSHTAAIMSGSSQEIESLDSLLKDSEISLVELSTEKLEMMTEVIALRENIVTHLDYLQRDFFKCLTETVEKRESCVKERMSDIRSLKAAIEQSQNRIKAADVCQDDAHLVMAVQEVLSDRQLYQQRVQDHITQYTESKVVMEVNEAVKEILCISSIAEANDVSLDALKRYNMASLIDTISFNRSPCRITGAIYAKQNLVAVDERNECIYCYSMEGQLKFELKLEGDPWDVCNVTDNVIAVSRPKNKCISLIKVTDDGFSLTEEISVGESFHGIAYVGNEFLVTCPGVYKVMVFDKSHNVQNTFEDKSGKMWHAAAIKREVGFVVSMRTKSKGDTMLNSFKEKKRLQSFLVNDFASGARGLDTDDYGNIYVCATSSNHVLMVSPTGQSKILLSGKDGITEPCAIAVYGDRMAVFEERNATGKIFRLLR